MAEPSTPREKGRLSLRLPSVTRRTSICLSHPEPSRPRVGEGHMITDLGCNTDWLRANIARNDD